jgi:hypothetical protein
MDIFSYITEIESIEPNLAVELQFLARKREERRVTGKAGE